MKIPLKIDHIGTLESGVLHIHGSFSSKESLEVFKKIINDIDFFGANEDEFYDMLIPINILKKIAMNYWVLSLKFPYFNPLELNNVQNSYDYFADKYLPLDQNIDSILPIKPFFEESIFRRFWLYEKYLLYVNRSCISKEDYEYIKLKVEEFIFLGKEEVTALKNKVSRLKEMTYLSANKRNTIPDEILSFVLKRDRQECVSCGSKDNLQFDHILPVSRGGNDEPENLRVLCRSCNLSRGNLSKFY